MSRMNNRLSNHVDPKDAEVVVMPAEHVDIADIENGTDGAMVNLVDEINGERTTYAQCRDDNASLSEIATSLEEFSMLAMEGINAETGLEAQTLLAMQYGSNHHLKRIGQSITFTSLESNDIGNLEKTILTVEGLGESIGKVWDGLVNVAKRAGESIKTFFKHMLNFYVKMKEKLTALKSQLLALEDHAEGPLKTSAAKRLSTGDNGRQILSQTQAIFKGFGAYLDKYMATTMASSKGIVDELTGVDSAGVPTVDPEKIRSYLETEQNTREQLLGLGLGSRPRQQTKIARGVALHTDASGLLPGGYRLTSISPELTNHANAPGLAMSVMDECDFTIEADKPTSKLETLPTLKIKEALTMVDALLNICDRLEKAVEKSFTSADHFWDLEDAGFHERVEKSFKQMSALSQAEMKEVVNTVTFKEAAAKGRKVGFFVLKYAMLGIAIGSAVATGSALALLCIPVSWGVGYLVYWVPTYIVGSALGMLFKGFMKPGAQDTADIIGSDDPNAAVLYVLRGVLTTRSWIGAYTVDTVYALCDYLRHVGPAWLDYIGDCAKAHLKAQKAAVSTAAEEPAVA